MSEAARPGMADQDISQGYSSQSTPHGGEAGHAHPALREHRHKRARGGRRATDHDPDDFDPEAMPPLRGHQPREMPAVGKPKNAFETVAIGVVAIAALYFAREIFVPLALSLLLSFALAPLVLLLRRANLGRVPSVIAAVFLGFLVFLGFGALIGGQMAHLARNLPEYQSNIVHKIRALRGTTADNSFMRQASGMLRDLSGEITGTGRPVPAPNTGGKNAAPNPAANANGAPGPDGKPAALPASPAAPVPVEIHQPDPTTVEIIQTFLKPMLQPLATIGIVIVFVFFFLLQREDLRGRFIRLAGARELQRTTQGLDDAARRLSRYLLMQTAVNASFGVVIGLGLWAIGIPNPVLWGLIAMLLRFVPYIGPPIAALFPALMALAIDPGWTKVLWIGALFLAVEPITSQGIEPFLYGNSTGLSAVAVVLAAAFWTWLWGPVGLLLSTPLTLCLVVLGRYVERLEFLVVMLGDRPPLTPEQNFYQRMLAGDPDEAAHHAETFMKERTLAAYYDEVAVRGLALAQHDVDRGVLRHDHRVQIKDAVLGVIDNLADNGAPVALTEKRAAEKRAAPPSASAIMCVSGRGSLDEAVAAMLAHLLERRGLSARVVPNQAVSPARIGGFEVDGATTFCLSYLDPDGFAPARYMVRRLRRLKPGARIMVGFWTLTDEEARSRNALAETGADMVVTSLTHAVDVIAIDSMVGETSPGLIIPAAAQ